MSVEERKAWSETVFRRMQTKLNITDYDKVFLHTGKNYREYLIPKLERVSLLYRVPLGSLSIGKELKWYKAELTNL